MYAYLACKEVALILQSVDKGLCKRVSWFNTELVFEQEVVLELLILGSQLIDGSPVREKWDVVAIFMLK